MKIYSLFLLTLIMLTGCKTAQPKDNVIYSRADTTITHKIVTNTDSINILAHVVRLIDTSIVENILSKWLEPTTIDSILANENLLKLVNISFNIDTAVGNSKLNISYNSKTDSVKAVISTEIAVSDTNIKSIAILGLSNENTKPTDSVFDDISGFVGNIVAYVLLLAIIIAVFMLVRKFSLRN